MIMKLLLIISIFFAVGLLALLIMADVQNSKNFKNLTK